MTKITIRRNALDPSQDQVFESDKVGDFLYSHFEFWPDTAVIYKETIGEESKVEIECASDVEDLNKLSGHIIVVIYPAGLFAIATLVIAANVAAIFLGGSKEKSKSDEVAQRKEPTVGSPNNGLSARGNTERIAQRIPDIFGCVRSYPDVLLPSHIEYQSSQEVEFGYYCVGRGEYEITEIKEDETLIDDIKSASVEVYGPNTSPNSGAPQLTVNKSISEPFITAKTYEAVNGQKLFAPNTAAVYSDSRFKFFPTGRIEVDNSQNIPDPNDPDWTPPPDISFTDYFQSGDELQIYGSLNIDGTYDILAVEADSITLADPSDVNSYWDNFPSGGIFQSGGMYLITPGDRSIGPFIVEDADEVYCNFVAENGIYQDDGETQSGFVVQVEIKVQEIDSDDNPVGSPYTKIVNLQGSSANRSRIAITGKTSLPFSGRVSVSAKRLTDTDLTFEGTIEDTIQWEGLLVVKDIDESDFGDVTTIRTVTRANSASLSTGQRKLNCKAFRKIPSRQNDGSFVTKTTSDFADIVRFVCLDEKIGNRDISELDEDNFYSVRDAVVEYFGTVKASEFNYTFDEEDFSFEETLFVICETVFCTPFRRGSLIQLFFEKQTEESSLLFNHRNKIPNSESRTVSFGRLNDKDGVEIEYVDSSDGSKVKIHIPADQSAINAEKIRQLGITNKIQAYFHAHRAWNKLQYQNCAVEFDALQEAAVLNLNERILVADNTRTQTFDGEVLEQNGNTLTLSQPVVFDSTKDYTIFLQNVDGSVQSIPVRNGNSEYQVILDQSTNLPLATSEDFYSRSVYEIVANDSDRKNAFLVDEKLPRDNFTTRLKVVNYDDRFYSSDKDFIDGIVNENGNII